MPLRGKLLHPFECVAGPYDSGNATLGLILKPVRARKNFRAPGTTGAPRAPGALAHLVDLAHLAHLAHLAQFLRLARVAHLGAPGALLARTAHLAYWALRPPHSSRAHHTVNSHVGLVCIGVCNGYPGWVGCLHHGSVSYPMCVAIFALVDPKP